MELGHSLGVTSHRLGFLMAWRSLHIVNDQLDLTVLLLQSIQTFFLPNVFVNEVFDLRLRFNVNHVFLEVCDKLVDEEDEVGADTHHHVADVFAPPSHVTASPCIVLNGELGLGADFVEQLHLRDVAFVDVLHVFLIDQAGETLKTLLFRRVEVEAAAVDGTPLAEAS